MSRSSSMSIPSVLITEDMGMDRIKRVLKYMNRKPHCPLCGKKWGGWEPVKRSLNLSDDEHESMSKISQSGHLLRAMIALELGVCPVCFQP